MIFQALYNIKKEFSPHPKQKNKQEMFVKHYVP